MFYELVKEGLLRVAEDIQRNRNVLEALNSTCLHLIPKKEKLK